MSVVEAIATHFVTDATLPLKVQEYGAGNINDTYLVTPRFGTPFILQRINQRVFKHPEWIMHNIRVFTAHVQTRLQSVTPLQRRWEVPQIIPTQDGHAYLISAQGEFWRALSFIAHARSYAKIQNLHHAQEVGYALGQFHRLVSDLDTTRLYDTLEGYHITPRYLAHYEAVSAQRHGYQDSAEVAYAMRFLSQRRDAIPVLEQAKQQGRLRLRPTHGDPKVDNVMIANDSGQAVGIIDLDTIKPGLVHYDIGDCLRSGCNPAGEETEDLTAVSFEIDLCRAILQGYLPLVHDFYTAEDYAYLYPAIRLLALEQGLRFFTDYLAGNVYYKVKHEKHNLIRALVQFTLTASIEKQEADIRAVIESCRRMLA